MIANKYHVCGTYEEESNRNGLCKIKWKKKKTPKQNDDYNWTYVYYFIDE